MTPADVRLRRAGADDVDFLLALANDPGVEPFLGGRSARDRDGLRGEVERSLREPASYGRFVIEAGGERVGSLGFDCVNERSRIARLERLAVHPAHRGRGIADTAARLFQRHLLLELGFHRLELEIYGFNERAQRHAERAGFVREGVKRRAYLRHGGWADGVLYALLPEDLEPGAVDLLRRYVAQHNHSVRTGAWEPLATFFAEGAVLEFEGVPVGPFHGRDAIGAAYRERPPDDTVELLEEPVADGATVSAAWAWGAEPAVRAGELRAKLEDGLIARLVVAVGK